MWPHSVQRRRWNHHPPEARHSTQPSPLGGTLGSIREPVTGKTLPKNVRQREVVHCRTSAARASSRTRARSRAAPARRGARGAARRRRARARSRGRAGSAAAPRAGAPRRSRRRRPGSRARSSSSPILACWRRTSRTVAASIVGIAQQVQRQLFVRDEPRLPVEPPDHVGERLEARLERVAGDHRRLERVDQLAHALLERREEQRLTRAEVVLDDTPRDAGALRDPVRARAVEAFLEDAVDRGVDQTRARRGRGGRGGGHVSRVADCADWR